jgi:hypothetical protein
VLLPGFQKGRDIKPRLLKEKGREKFWPKKGNLRRTRKNKNSYEHTNVFTRDASKGMV